MTVHMAEMNLDPGKRRCPGTSLTVAYHAQFFRSEKYSIPVVRII